LDREPQIEDEEENEEEDDLKNDFPTTLSPDSLGAA